MLVCFLLVILISRLEAYSNNLFTVATTPSLRKLVTACRDYSDINKTVGPTAKVDEDVVEDPYEVLEMDLNRFLFGKEDSDDDDWSHKLRTKHEKQLLMQNVMGNAMRAELYNGRSAVHLISPEFIHKGYCLLNVTKDHMQTAINAFAIFLYCHTEDIERLPADYVLRSSRSISMMRIERDKLAATWNVVMKEYESPMHIPHQTLEKYRPLFKYLSGHEIAQLNLSDDRILRFIGTHPDLNRHQVGVVASKYMKINKNWGKENFLNKLNNLLCGIPISLVRHATYDSYFTLAHQVFYHIRACDHVQRTFYLTKMTKALALGKSFGWNAQDVSRLGLLLSEVEGSQLAAIKPEAMAGIAPQIMQIIPAARLESFTEEQMKHLSHKSLYILLKRRKKYREQSVFDGSDRQTYKMGVSRQVNARHTL
ncbi:uncharacterized protein LOC121729525 [Aricia agestis]|uniref:uncharacterized protein LOC121729525 n=1 Tax=Aricia agestis TaxID=91739 RepID=UPI001C2070F5|nr:uncharacterized protein LOC121729525 [Aricia agestis]